MQRRTEIEIALFLSNDSKEWDVSIMSRTEHQEMKSQISSLLDWTWKRQYDKLLTKKLEHEQRQRQLRLQQLLLQQQKQTKQRQLQQQEQERLEDERKQQEQTKRQILLMEEHSKEWEFRRQLASTVQDLKLLWKLQNDNEQRPQPDQAPLFRRPPGRPLRFLRPPPSTGTMPVL